MRAVLQLLLLAALAGLVSCGGGGGGGGGDGQAAGPTACPVGERRGPSGNCVLSIVPVITCNDGREVASLNECNAAALPPPSPVTCPDGTTMVTPPAMCPMPPIPELAVLGTQDNYFMATTPADASHGDFGSNILAPSRVERRFDNGINFLHRRLEGILVGNNRLDLDLPPLDVRTAWQEGWTGNEQNILIMDDFGPRENVLKDCSARTPQEEARDSNCWDGSGSQHGFGVSISALQTAPRANILAINFPTRHADVSYRNVEVDVSERGSGLRDANTNAILPADTQIDVMNWSWGTAPNDECAPSVSTCNPSQADIQYWWSHPVFNDALGIATPEFLVPTIGLEPLTGAADAVLTKAAGNSGADAGYISENVALARHSNLAQRALIVGWLDKWAQDGRADLHRISNYAGDNPHIQARFLVEYGGPPYAELTFLCDRDTTPNCNDPKRIGNGAYPSGTSFAAPRVAGFAALLRHKFPELTGPQTAGILLETATTEGLACHRGGSGTKDHTNCPMRRYGHGRVNIQRALAPLGRLQ